MITDEERAIHFKECRARWAEPDLAIRVEGGRGWVRDQPKQCPHCDSTFFTFRPANVAPALCRVDPHPEPRDACQARDTCGSPKCHEDEILLHVARIRALEAARTKAKGPAAGPDPQQAAPPKLRKGPKKNQPETLIPLKDLSHGE